MAGVSAVEGELTVEQVQELERLGRVVGVLEDQVHQLQRDLMSAERRTGELAALVVEHHTAHGNSGGGRQPSTVAYVNAQIDDHERMCHDGGGSRCSSDRESSRIPEGV